jgi:hypothetical protein
MSALSSSEPGHQERNCTTRWRRPVKIIGIPEKHLYRRPFDEVGDTLTKLTRTWASPRGLVDRIAD